VFLFSKKNFELFSRAIHGLSVSFLGPITPIGGLLLLGAWAYLSVLLGKMMLA
jgi:uncharacterized membrane protein YgdD (TMEM256/DUF423 family)